MGHGIDIKSENLLRSEFKQLEAWSFVAFLSYTHVDVTQKVHICILSRHFRGYIKKTEVI